MQHDEKRYLHFTLGPVQGFVAQARRTRDLWAGSFLLSYLAGQAMVEVLNAGGEIVFPYVGQTDSLQDPMLRAMTSEKNYKVTSGPSLGSIPNRFKAKIPKGFEPNLCEAAVGKAWEKIASCVWDHYLAPLEGEIPEIGDSVHAIWERQIKGFWDIVWVVGENNDLLDRRKNWRTLVPTEEAGSKCTVMGSYQEISGYERIKNRADQERFWSVVRSKLPPLDLRDDERLCAIALVKRLFPHVAKEAIGWFLPEHFPSTTAVSALPWIARRIHENPEHCRNFVRFFPKKYPEQRIARSRLLKEVLGAHPDKELVNFACLEGTSFYADHLVNDRWWEEPSKIVRQKLIGILQSWDSKPSPFYALLLMDGDRLGALLQRGEEAGTRISQALAGFTGGVEALIEEASGFVIYAGGDDLLVMLPVDTAMTAAVKARQLYQQAFINSGLDGWGATISGAIVFAHHSTPLRDVLTSAHKLLDEKAKEDTGRDSLAVCILRSSGPGFIWASPWDYFIENSGEDEGNNRITRLVKDFQPLEDGKSLFNSSYIYNLRSRYETLIAAEGKDNNSLEMNEDFYVSMFVAEYFKNTERKQSVEQSRVLCERLYKICRRVYRDESGQICTNGYSWSIDGALMVRFLANKGVEE